MALAVLLTGWLMCVKDSPNAVEVYDVRQECVMKHADICLIRSVH